MTSYATYIAPTQIANPTAMTAANSNSASTKRIDKAAQDFEGMFISEMLRPVFDNMDTGSFDGGEGGKMYKSMLVDEYGKNMAKAGGIGIAKNVKAELLKLQEAKTHQATINTETKNVASQ